MAVNFDSIPTKVQIPTPPLLALRRAVGRRGLDPERLKRYTYHRGQIELWIQGAISPREFGEVNGACAEVFTVGDRITVHYLAQLEGKPRSLYLSDV